MASTAEIHREIDEVEGQLGALRTRTLNLLAPTAEQLDEIVAELEEIQAKIAELRRQDAEEGTA